VSKNKRKAFYEGNFLLPKGVVVLKIEEEDPENNFLDLFPTKEEPKPLEQLPSKLEHQMISPSKHKVEVQSNTPFLLIFSESFHPLWQAFTIEEGKKSIFDLHEKVNGYANGFYINKTGNFTIWIEFLPQKLFNICLTISGLGLLISILLLGFGLRKRFNKGQAN